MTKVHWGWLIWATLAILALSWRSHLMHDLLIEQQQITQELIDTLDLQTKSLELIGDRTGRTQDLAICNSLVLRETAWDLTGTSSQVSALFRGCME